MKYEDWRAAPRRQMIRSRPGTGPESRYRDRFRCTACGGMVYCEIDRSGKLVEVIYDRRSDRWQHQCPKEERG